MISDPLVEEHQGRLVVRDDLLPGGTKRRALPVLFGDTEEYVYAGPVFGYAQIALAHAAADMGKRATVFVAFRKQAHARSLMAKAAGAKVVQVPAGYLTNVTAKARRYAEQVGAKILPFGLDDEQFIGELSAVAQRTKQAPPEVWVAAGSGTLTRALQIAWPNAKHVAVLVGKQSGDYGKAQILNAPEKFEQDAKRPPPFPSCSNYDAKVWQFFSRSSCSGALFWNVGA